MFATDFWNNQTQTTGGLGVTPNKGVNGGKYPRSTRRGYERAIKECSPPIFGTTKKEIEGQIMKAFITVLGKDRVGIIASVATLLAENGINVEDISQTILQGNFTMVMTVSLPKEACFETIKKILDNKGKELSLEIAIRHMDIFDAINRV